jgi:hypothetical protein
MKLKWEKVGGREARREREEEMELFLQKLNDRVEISK